MKKSFLVSAFALALVVPLVVFAHDPADDSNDRVNSPEVLEGAPNPSDIPEAQPSSSAACCNTNYVAEGSFADPQIHTNGRVGTAVPTAGEAASN